MDFFEMVVCELGLSCLGEIQTWYMEAQVVLWEDVVGEGVRNITQCFLWAQGSPKYSEILEDKAEDQTVSREL